MVPIGRNQQPPAGRSMHGHPVKTLKNDNDGHWTILDAEPSGFCKSRVQPYADVRFMRRLLLDIKV